MQAQEYLKEQIELLKVFVNSRNKKMLELNSMFKEKGAIEEADIKNILEGNNMSDEDLNLYYSVSVMSNDVNIISKKIADLIYFSKILNIDLDIEGLSDINGFMSFLKDYTPYETTHILTPEKQTKEANTELFKKNRELFKKALGQKGVMDLIDEARDKNPS